MSLSDSIIWKQEDIDALEWEYAPKCGDNDLAMQNMGIRIKELEQQLAECKKLVGGIEHESLPASIAMYMGKKEKEIQSLQEQLRLSVDVKESVEKDVKIHELIRKNQTLQQQVADLRQQSEQRGEHMEKLRRYLMATPREGEVLPDSWLWNLHEMFNEDGTAK